MASSYGPFILNENGPRTIHFFRRYGLAGHLKNVGRGCEKLLVRGIEPFAGLGMELIENRVVLWREGRLTIQFFKELYHRGIPF